MTVQPVPLDSPVALLAEHLDMILAAAEDLAACRVTAASPGGRRLDSEEISLRSFVRDLKRYEFAAILRVQRARELTRKMVGDDKRFAMLGGLFVSGTAALDEAVREVIDRTAGDFENGRDALAYLRSRGIISDEEGSITGPVGELSASDGFLIAGVIELGPLADLVATFLDTLERHYDIFAENPRLATLAEV